MNPKDSDFYPQLLYNHLLGGERDGPGLLRRVETIVLAQASPDGPTYRTGSIIPTGTIASDSSRESGFSERTFELLVAVIQWLGAGIREDSVTERKLATYLVENKITDVDLLLGPTGRLTQARRRVHDLMQVITAQNIEKVQSLATFLGEWIGDDCDHAWEEVESIGSVSVYRCGERDCGLRRYEGRDGAWLAV